MGEGFARVAPFAYQIMFDLNLINGGSKPPPYGNESRNLINGPSAGMFHSCYVRSLQQCEPKFDKRGVEDVGPYNNARRNLINGRFAVAPTTM